MRDDDGLAFAPVPTIIVEPHQLIREGLSSIISSSPYSSSPYRVLDSVPGVSGLSKIAIPKDTRALVLLGSIGPHTECEAASQIRARWPHAKIVLLFDRLSQDECQRLIDVDINACVPLLSSRHVLMNALDLVVFGHVRLIVMNHTGGAAPAPSDLEEHCSLSEASVESLPQSSAACSLVPEPPVIVPDAQLASPADAHNPLADEHGAEQPANGHAAERAPRNSPKLSSREWQILDGLVKGHANKVIARDCNITEATVKVHMKSILRKIRVGNRTQAAVWAVANGSTAEEINHRLIQAVADF